jgi:Response regulator containing CheY-like receiver domain and AraC-type DNA-binding domain
MKILIVEDEYNAREGLAALIEKINPDYEICAKAADGDEGYRLAVSLKPELMFVDIELPKLNGLQMIEKILGTDHSASQPPLFIILSGYAEFQYAQQAIQYGVEEYLLKPLTPDKLKSVLDKMDKICRMKRDHVDKKTVEKDQILKDIVLNLESGSVDELDRIKESVIPDHMYAVNVYYGQNTDIAGLKNAAISFCSLNNVKDFYISTLGDYKFETFFINTEYVQADIIRKLNSGLVYTLRKLGLADFTITLLPIEKVEDLRHLLHDIVNLNAWALTLGNDTTIYPELTACAKHEGDKKIERFDIKALSALKNEDIDELSKIGHEFLSYLKSNRFPPEQIKRNCTSFAFTILMFYKETNTTVYEKMQSDGLLDRIKNSCTGKELNDCLDELINAYKLAPQIQQKVNSILVKKIIHRIADSYINKVSLEDIAAHMNVSPEYLSHLFTKEVGISFSEYLKNYRINVAKRLMSTSAYKIYEIGEKIGYKDPKYFCKVFKEVTGYSPKEYMSK